MTLCCDDVVCLMFPRSVAWTDLLDCIQPTKHRGLMHNNTKPQTARKSETRDSNIIWRRGRPTIVVVSEWIGRCFCASSLCHHPSNCRMLATAADQAQTSSPAGNPWTLIADGGREEGVSRDGCRTRSVTRAWLAETTAWAWEDGSENEGLGRTQS